MTSIDVDLDGPEPDPAPAFAHRRRRALAVVVGLAVAVVVALGVRVVLDDAVAAAALPDPDTVLAAVAGLRVEDGAAMATRLDGTGTASMGSTWRDGPRTVDVVVACTSVDGAPVQVVVRSGNAEVASTTAPCTHGGDAAAGPTESTLEAVPLDASWTVRLTSGSAAVVAVVTA